VRARDTIEAALELEYRFTSRRWRQGDFLEGHPRGHHRQGPAPRWQHEAMEAQANREVSAMLLPLGADGLKL
jgi:enoyl-CoA hydratase